MFELRINASLSSTNIVLAYNTIIFIYFYMLTIKCLACFDAAMEETANRKKMSLFLHQPQGRQRFGVCIIKLDGAK